MASLGGSLCLGELCCHHTWGRGQPRAQVQLWKWVDQKLAVDSGSLIWPGSSGQQELAFLPSAPATNLQLSVTNLWALLGQVQSSQTTNRVLQTGDPRPNWVPARRKTRSETNRHKSCPGVGMSEVLNG